MSPPLGGVARRVFVMGAAKTRDKFHIVQIGSNVTPQSQSPFDAVYGMQQQPYQMFNEQLIYHSVVGSA
jgi:hypothetical protein